MSKKLKVESLKLLEPELVQRDLQPFKGEFIKGENALVPALREARRVNDSGFDRIWKYYFEPKKNVLLSEHEEEVRKRLKHAWELLTGKVLNDRKAVLAHTSWCKENFMEISERTAYDDVRRAKMLFGDPRVSTAMFEKARMSAILLDQIENMKRISDSGANEEKIEAAKAINALARRYNAVNGLEEDIRTQIPRPAITINFNSDPDVLKKQAAELMEGVAIDTDYTEAE